MSDLAKALFECTLSGDVLETIHVPAIQQEGVVFSDDERTIIVVGEPNEVFQFTRRAVSSTSRGGTNVTIQLRLSKPLTPSAAADFSVLGINAVSGQDFDMLATNTVQFLPGMTSTSITINILADLPSSEEDEFISITISNMIVNAHLVLNSIICI